MRPRSSLPPAAQLLIAGTALAGAGVAAYALAETDAWRSRDVVAFVAVAVGIVVAQRLWIPLRHRHETESFSLTDAPLMAALFLARPGVLTLGLATGVLIGQVSRRVAAHKVAFNVGQHLVGISLALLAYEALGRPGVDRPAAWLAGLVAMALYFMVNEGAVALAISLVSGQRFRDVLFPPFHLRVVNWVGNATLGILGAVIWVAEPLGLMLLLAPLSLAYVGYRGWFSSARERDHIDEMVKTADAIAERSELTARVEELEDDGEGAVHAARTLNRMLDRLEGAVYSRERQFLSEASHELKTPITICRGHLEVLDQNPSPIELRRTVALLIDELGRMGRIVEDMVTLASAEHSEFLRPEPLDLQRFLDDIAVKASTLLNGRLQVAPAPPGAVVRADPQRLTQALLNLLHNAAVHTPQATPVRLHASGEPGGLRIEVRDDGAGLPTGHEESVFEPFWRGDISCPGTGLGLAIVRAVAEAHGGVAGARNNAAAGATFWIRLPA